MATATDNKNELTPARKYRQLTTGIARSMLVDWVGEDRAKEAAGRISAALSASAAAARNPDDFYACTPESIGRCIAIAALTEIMPGTGSTALAYLIPRRPRKNERPQLQYQLSHRGLNALARRTGQTMIPVPIGVNDELRFDEDGDVRVVHRDIDHPPTSEDDLRGIIILVRELSNGKTICRGWVPVSLINTRRETSDSYQYACKNQWAQSTDPWHVWYVEMAIKTAMHYAISRGWCVVDDAAAVRAISNDQTQDLAVVSVPPQRLEGNSRTDEMADFLSDGEADHNDHGEAGEESQVTDETIGEESQEVPEASESEPPSDQAMGFIARLNDAKTNKELQGIFGEAQQLKLANKMSETDFAEIKNEFDACKKPAKK